MRGGARGWSRAVAVGALAVALAGSCGTAVGHTASPAPAAPVRRLPIVEVPARRPGGDALAIVLTGDGGWASLVKDVATALAADGVAVVGLDLRAYLSPRRTPEETARDVARLATTYLDAWHRDRLVLVGYSRGADIVPFVANRLPPELRARLALVAMLGLAREASFEFHWIDMLRDVHRASDRPVAPELARLHGVRMLCVYGTKERDSLCRAADSTFVQKVARPGGHHFDRNYPALAALIREAMPPR